MYEWLNMWAEQYGSHEALCDNKGSYYLSGLQIWDCEKATK